MATMAIIDPGLVRDHDESMPGKEGSECTVTGDGSDLNVRQHLDVVLGDVTVRSRVRPMLGYLRIAVTAISLTVCLLSILYLVRSYRTLDALELYFGYGYGGHIGSSDRGMEFCVGTGKTDFPNAKPGINYHAKPKKEQSAGEQGLAKYGFRTFAGPAGVYFLQTPHWFVILIATTLSVAPWLRRQFSLRSLLIGITLVAVLLGIIAVSG